MKKSIKYLILSMSLAAILAGCSGEGTDNAQLETDVSPVTSKINSTVSEVRVIDNQQVKKGDILIVLDTATFKIAVVQAEIALMQASTNVKLAVNGNTMANVNVSNQTATSSAVSENLSSADAAIETANAQLKVAQKNKERYAELLAQKSTTQQQFDRVDADKIDAEAKLKTAMSQKNALLKQVEASQLQVSSKRTEVSNTTENISLSGLAVRQAQANLDAAKLQLSYCNIVAPADGVVSKKNVQVGQVVAVGEPLMAIANNRTVWVVANYKETQLQKMRVGQDVEVDVDAYPDTTFIGKLESFSQATGSRFSFLPADNATGNFVKVTQRVPVKITLPLTNSGKYPLRAGMSVYVKVKTN